MADDDFSPERYKHLYPDDKFLVVSDDDQPDSPSDLYGPWLGVGVFIGFIVLAAFMVAVIMYLNRAQERRTRNVKEAKREEVHESIRKSVVCKPWDGTETTTTRTLFSAGEDTFSDDDSSNNSGGGMSSNLSSPVANSTTASTSIQVACDDMECDICGNGYAPGEQLSRSNNPSCNHRFHKACIDKWLSIQNTCPTCNLSFALQNLSNSSPICTTATPSMMMMTTTAAPTPTVSNVMVDNNSSVELTV